MYIWGAGAHDGVLRVLLPDRRHLGLAGARHLDVCACVCVCVCVCVSGH